MLKIFDKYPFLVYDYRYLRFFNFYKNKMRTILKQSLIAVGLLAILILGVFLSGSFFQKKNLQQDEISFQSRESMDSAPADTGLPEHNLGEGYGSKMNSAVMQESAEDVATSPVAEKKMIKSGNLYLKVNEIGAAMNEISAIAGNNQGEIFSSEVSRTVEGKTRHAYVTVKVPATSFDKAFEELKKVASVVLTESVSGQDVTEQYADLQSRLRNKQAEEASFMKILEQAGKMDDVLMVTKELSRVRGEIELLQGRIRLMDSRIDMSSITMDITEDATITVVDTWRPWQVVKNSVNDLLESLQGMVDLVIKFFVQILPMLLIWSLLIWVIYRLSRRIFLKIKNRL